MRPWTSSGALVDDLRPSLLDHFGLPTALRTYVDAVCLKAGLQVDIDLAEEAQGLPRDTAIAVFRIVQEGLSNVIRHGGARHVRLRDGRRFRRLCSDAER